MKQDDLKSLFDDTGLKYKTVDNTLLTFWRINDDITLQILTFVNTNDDWINLTTRIDSLNAKSTEMDLRKLLRLNNRFIGSKFTLDQENRIYCNYELPSLNLNSEVLKKAIIAIVKNVQSYYAQLEENLIFDD